MKITIDTENRTLRTESGADVTEHSLYSKKSFELLSQQWLRVGWSLQYYLTFSWMGHPILQLPEDLLRLQEALFSLRPKIIVELGVYRGGSLMFLATICKVLNQGRVLGVDLSIPNNVKKSIENHLLAAQIDLIEGDSVSDKVIEQVSQNLSGADPILIILDSNHSKEHVSKELTSYADFVKPGSYFLVTDGIMKNLTNVPGGNPNWKEDNPCSAVQDFLLAHPEFEEVEPFGSSTEVQLPKTVTYWPNAWLRRKYS